MKLYDLIFYSLIKFIKDLQKTLLVKILTVNYGLAMRSRVLNGDLVRQNRHLVPLPSDLPMNISDGIDHDSASLL